MGNGAFTNCSSLESFTGKFASDDHRCLIVDGTLNSFAPAGLTSYTIPSSVTKIGAESFAFSSNLASVSIPNSVTEIVGGAFNGCSGLASFTGKFSSEDNRCLIVDGTLNSFAPAGLTSYVIPSSVKKIGNNAFYACENLTSITIPNSVTVIDSQAFRYCRGLTSITIPNSVNNICDRVFEYCENLTSVTIPNSVTKLGNGTFASCTSLAKINIPISVTAIGADMFQNCISLTSVTIPSSVTAIGQSAFHNCSSLESITIPNSVKVIYSYAFYLCSSLTSINIPNSVTKIGAQAFCYCSSLASVTIGNSVTEIGDYSFADCDVLKEITSFAINPPSITNSTFNGLSKDKIVLKVPTEAVDAYKADNKWKKFTNVVGLNISDEECEAPEIKLKEGQIIATSTTENATCNTTITSEDFKSVDTNAPIMLSGMYNVSSYAHATGRQDSEAVTTAIKWGNPSIQVSNNAMRREARKDEAKKCAEPEIRLIAGGFVATSATENSTCHTTITSEDFKSVDTNEPISISGVYNIYSYAHAEGYQNSDAVAALLVWVDPIDQGSTDILSPKTKKAVVIKTVGNNIVVCGTERGERIQLYSLDGMLLSTKKATDGETTIPHSLQSGQTYIIKYGDKSVKYKF